MSEVAQIEKPKDKDVSFSEALITRIDEIAPLLPAHIKKERFVAAAKTAVKQNPELLECTVRSLFNALARAAQDGLLPDGREGVINHYKTKVETPKGDKWLKVASWNPMAYGLRKRARELDDIIIDAQVVHENDHFVWHQGDEPRIEHEPAKLGTERGPMIGTYAIFRANNGQILHREVMDRLQVMAVREQSKAKDSLMWTKFETEGWRKSVVRRGIKTVPVSETLERVITRGDEEFDFASHADENKPVAALVPPPPPPPAITKQAPLQTVPPIPPANDAMEIPVFLRRETSSMVTELDDAPADELAERIEGYIEGGRGVMTLDSLDELDNEVCAILDTANRDDQRSRWNIFYASRKTALKAKRA